MIVHVPPAIKQKFSPQARTAYLRDGATDKIVSGIAMIADALTISGPNITITPLTSGYCTVQLPASRLTDLANDDNLTYFELSTPMGV